MFKVFTGVVLGIITSYYAASYLHFLDGPMSHMGIGRPATSTAPHEQVLASNTFNATPPNQLERKPSSQNIWRRIDLALRLARLNPPDEITQKEVIDVLTVVAQRDPDIRTLFSSKTTTDLTNSEAIAMLSLVQRYVSFNNTH